jgi:hypothetical protein
MKVSLALPPGVARGPTASYVEGRWFDTNLIRWRGGRLMPVGGWERMTETPLASTPRALATWVDTLDVRRHAVGCDGHLLILTGDSVLDATPPGFAVADSAITRGGFGAGKYGRENFGDARQEGSTTLARAYSFSLAAWGEDVLAVASFDGRLMRWTPQKPQDKATVISQAPQGARAMIVTDERHVVMIGSAVNPRRVSWCSREDYTDWNFASVTNTAGFIDMNTDGLPVALARVREGILIFTEIDVWLMRFVGSPYIYSLERIGETTSLISPNSIATFGGRAVWMGREGFFLYDGGYVKPLPSDVGGFLYADMDAYTGIFRAHAAPNGSFPEIWFFYPSEGATECDRYALWNYEENWWALGKLERTVAAPAGVAKFPMMASPDGHLYQHESGWTAAGLTRVGQVYATSPTIRVGDGGDRQLSVLQTFPDLNGAPKAASFTFDVRDTPDGPPRRAGPYLARSDGYMDARFTGRDVQLTVTATADDLWTLGKPILEAKPRGRR